ncbi:unnamed protein product [Protopolystoma xenopodis]|uniref:Uncharacterized protein n=1 Tax=Protopolystoma xenopodis TaxID=117903 RepID=A0A448WV67_9PLAT|nr:unnamed protein product [Protopolystoma xenopodis]
MCGVAACTPTVGWPHSAIQLVDQSGDGVELLYSGLYQIVAGPGGCVLPDGQAEQMIADFATAQTVDDVSSWRQRALASRQL